MGALKETTVGCTVTVSRVHGSRAIRKKLESAGIMAGADVVFNGPHPDGCVVSTLRGEVILSPEEADAVQVGPWFKREGDPVLPSGCCSYGNLGGLLDRIEDTFDRMERETEERA